jgi:hypothetical protein
VPGEAVFGEKKRMGKLRDQAKKVKRWAKKTKRWAEKTKKTKRCAERTRDGPRCLEGVKAMHFICNLATVGKLLLRDAAP